MFACPSIGLLPLSLQLQYGASAVAVAVVTLCCDRHVTWADKSSASLSQRQRSAQRDYERQVRDRDCTCSLFKHIVPTPSRTARYDDQQIEDP